MLKAYQNNNATSVTAENKGDDICLISIAEKSSGRLPKVTAVGAIKQYLLNISGNSDKEPIRWNNATLQKNIFRQKNSCHLCQLHRAV